MECRFSILLLFSLSMGAKKQNFQVCNGEQVPWLFKNLKIGWQGFTFQKESCILFLMAWEGFKRNGILNYIILHVLKYWISWDNCGLQQSDVKAKLSLPAVDQRSQEARALTPQPRHRRRWTQCTYPAPPRASQLSGTRSCRAERSTQEAT